MNIFLTGATGLLGGELLVELSKLKEVSKIFCLVRAKNNAEAKNRIATIFNLRNDFFDKNKVIPCIGDLLHDNLADLLSENKTLANVDTIIQAAANTSFSKIYNQLVEDTNIGGLYNIVNWAKKLPYLNNFVYVGTASICGSGVKNKIIYENEFPDKKTKHFVKYTYTKMQGEIIIQKELPVEKILIVRPSIIMGDSRHTTPRSPVILWALATLNALRLCPVNEKSKLDIIPNDYAAEAIIKLLFAKRKHQVYHISSGMNSHTTLEKLLVAIGPYYNDLPPFCFIPKSSIPQIKKWARGSIESHCELAKHSEYLKFWQSEFHKKQNLRIIFAGLEPYLEFIELNQVFDKTRLLQDTDIGTSAPAHEYVTNNIEYLKKIDLLEGAVNS